MTDKWILQLVENISTLHFSFIINFVETKKNDNVCILRKLYHIII